MPILVATLNLLAAQDDGSAGAAAFFSLFTCGVFCALPVIILGINIALMFWMAKDAKSRGMEGAIWIILVLLTGFIGFLIYLFSRPQGNLIQCPNCGNNRLQASVKCPHCGIEGSTNPYTNKT
jgi:hypothetical protein